MSVASIRGVVWCDGAHRRLPSDSSVPFHAFHSRRLRRLRRLPRRRASRRPCRCADCVVSMGGARSRFLERVPGDFSRNKTRVARRRQLLDGAWRSVVQSAAWRRGTAGGRPRPPPHPAIPFLFSSVYPITIPPFGLERARATRAIPPRAICRGISAFSATESR